MGVPFQCARTSMRMGWHCLENLHLIFMAVSSKKYHSVETWILFPVRMNYDTSTSYFPFCICVLGTLERTEEACWMHVQNPL